MLIIISITVTVVIFMITITSITGTVVVIIIVTNNTTVESFTLLITGRQRNLSKTLLMRPHTRLLPLGFKPDCKHECSYHHCAEIVSIYITVLFTVLRYHFSNYRMKLEAHHAY